MFSLQKYYDFLNNKMDIVEWGGWEVNINDIHPSSYPHQKDTIKWAARIGRGLIAKSFGLGKTQDAIELAKLVVAKTDGIFLIVAPLGVRHHFVHVDGPRLGTQWQYVTTDEEIKATSNQFLITNYERVRDGNIDPRLHNITGVILDEGCFVAGTLVGTPDGPRPIETLKPGDSVLSAAGTDTVAATTTRVAKRLVKLRIVNSGSIISSDNHPYLTTNGWKRADELYEGDELVTQSEAVRILRGNFYSKDKAGQILYQLLRREMANQPTAHKEGHGAQKATALQDLRVVRKAVRGTLVKEPQKPVLQPFLLFELANDTTGNISACSFSRGSRQTWSQQKGLSRLWKSWSEERNRAHQELKSISKPRHTEKDFRNNEEKRQPSPLDRREGTRLDRSAREAFSRIVGELWRWMGNGIRSISKATTTGHANLLLHRYCMSSDEFGYRGGWFNARVAKGSGSRQTEREISPRSRVESVEVLEPGNPELDRYRNSEGEILVYDLQVSKHPSFSVNGLLVHNSVLRSLGSKTYDVFSEIFAKVPYRWVATATPSPNNFREILGYADFLGVMDRGQALTRFFQRNVDKAGDLTLIPAQEESFWLWVASWALFIFKPSDLGHSDLGYDMPGLKINWHRVPINYNRSFGFDSWGQYRLIPDTGGGIRQAMREKRDTIESRLAKAIEIINASPDNHFLLWHHLEAERKAIEMALPEAVTVYGSQKLETSEKHIIDFSNGKFRILASKPQICGSGCNFQGHCSDAVFLGVDFKFQDMIQAVHRIYRFQQKNEVNIHFIYAESEDDVINVFKQKWQQHDYLTEKMRRIVQEYGLTHWSIETGLKRNIVQATDRVEENGRLFTAVKTDSTLELFRLVEMMERGELNVV